jgi:pectate disaccharide-lyase
MKINGKFWVGLTIVVCFMAVFCWGGPSTVTATTSVIHVTTSGTASGTGTTSSPMTLAAAITNVAAGGIIYVHSGTYSFSSGITIGYGNNGASGSFKTITAVTGESAPILDFSGETLADSNRGLTINGNYWHIKKIKVTGAGDNGIFIGGSYNVIEQCITYANRDSGLQLGRRDTSLSSISDWPSYNLILNCDSYDNKDPDGEDADGFACKLTTGYGNVFRGCISHNNIDDGWDLYTKSTTGVIGPVVIEDCISYSNGLLSDGSTLGNGDGNGYKLGSSANAVCHIVRRCIAFYNKKHGFTDNSNSGPITVTQCTSWHNSMSSTTSQTTSNYNFAFANGTHTLSNNLSYVGGGNDHYVTASDISYSNIWWNKSSKTSTNYTGTIIATAVDFVSTPAYTFGTAPVSRNSDGSINYSTFFQLATSSDLVGAGVNNYDIGARGNVNSTTATMPYTLP